MSQPAYKFRRTNINLKLYIESRRYLSTKFRRDAEILVKQAEAIEGEMGELELSLIGVDEVKNEG